LKAPFLGFGSEEALRHIADALADGLFTTDAEGRVTFWNDAAERITGWSRVEAIGTDCSILAGDAVGGCSCGLGPIRCGLALSGRSSKQCTIRTRDGRRVAIVKSAVPLRDAAGEPAGALESFTLVRDGTAAEVPDGVALSGLVGGHPAMQELRRIVALVATSGATVMIVGESGAGKDRVAEAIHRLSPRADRALVRVPGASLDAVLDHAERGDEPDGPLRRARGGTLLLDEVGDLSPSAQRKLLSLLERREAGRASDARAADDFRVLCTTHSDLRAMVDERRFRVDLYFRLNVFPVRVPPLREHVEDVPAIAERFLARVAPGAALAPDAAQALAARSWPGNVRELQNVLEFAALRAGGGRIHACHVPDPAAPAAHPQVDERAQVVEALARSGGSRTLAARSLGISRVTLWKRIKRYGL
jgi:DNA-binding NtrC family response regulator